MANQPGGNNNFTPQGAQEVSILQIGPQLGKVIQVGVARPQAAAPMPTQISPPNAPRGTQPMALGGSREAPPAPIPPRQAPYFGPRTAMGAAPREAEGEVHVISVKGLGPDRREYVAEFDAVFPPGTKILGVTERMQG